MNKTRLRSLTRTGAPAVAAVAVLIFLTPALLAFDWPQYRGPSRHGVSAETGLLASWSQEGPREVWRQQIGSGFSGMAIIGDRLYTMAAGEKEEFVLCLDAQTGKVLWRTAVGERFASEFGDGPRSTPTVDHGVVFTVASSAKLVALDAKSGKILWHKEAEVLGMAPRFGYATSPLIEGNLVVVEMGGAQEGPGTAAFDRETGELKWQALEVPSSDSRWFCGAGSSPGDARKELDLAKSRQR